MMFGAAATTDDASMRSIYDSRDDESRFRGQPRTRMTTLAVHATFGSQRGRSAVNLVW